MSFLTNVSNRWQSTSTELQNRVVEVNYSPSDNTWRFFRFRDDKEHGNHSSVVQKVVQSIQDGVEREEVCTLLKLVTFEGLEYYQVNPWTNTTCLLLT